MVYCQFAIRANHRTNQFLRSEQVQILEKAFFVFSTTTTATSQMVVTQPTTNISAEENIVPSTSTNQVSVSSKFVSCVDIEEIDENSTEKV